MTDMASNPAPVDKQEYTQCNKAKMEKNSHMLSQLCMTQQLLCHQASHHNNWTQPLERQQKKVTAYSCPVPSDEPVLLSSEQLLGVLVQL